MFDGRASIQRIVPYNSRGRGCHFIHHVIQFGSRFVQMERESETRFSYLSERSTFGSASFGFQAKIGLVLTETENLIFDRNIWI